MANLVHFVREDFTERTNTSASAVEVTQFTVNWSDLTGAGFANGDTVLVAVLAKVGCSSNANYVRAQVGFGSTYAGRADVADSYMSLEASVTAAIAGQQYVWIDQRTLATNENIYFSLWGSSAADTHRAADYACIVFKIGGTNGLSSNDYHYAEATHSGDAPTSYDTAGASFTNTNAGDWLFIGCSHWLVDSTTADLLMDLSIAGNALAELDSEGEDLENELQIGTIAYVEGLAASSTCRARYRSDTAASHDCTRTAIVGIRLNAFTNRWGVQSTGTVTHSALDTFQTFASNSSFNLSATGNVLALAFPLHNFGEATKRPYGRIRLGGADWPSSGANRSAAEDNGAAAKTGPILHGYASVSAGTLNWTFDCAEDADITPNYSTSVQTAVVFSLSLIPTDYAVADTGAGGDQVWRTEGVPTDLVPMRPRRATAAGYDSLALPVYRKRAFARLPEVLLPEVAASVTQVNITDSGSGSDTPSVTTSVPVAESGSGSAETFTITSSFALADSGIGGPDIVSAITASFLLTDSGSGAEAVAAIILIPVNDVGTGVDALGAITADVPIVDEPEGVDSLSISTTLLVSDSGAGVDNITALLLFGVNDSGSGSDALSSLTASLTISDSGVGSESITYYSTIGLRLHTQPRRATPAGYDSLALPVFRKRPFARAAQYFVTDITEQTVSVVDSGAASDWIGGPPVIWDNGGTTWDGGSTVWYEGPSITVSASTPSDTGSGVDSVLRSEVGVVVTDSGVGVDSVGDPFYGLVVSDVALGSDLVTFFFNQFVTDSALTSDVLAVINDSAIHPIQRVPSYYPIWDAEPFVILKTPDFHPQLFWVPAQSFTISDSGSGVEVLVVSASVLVVDSGADSESVSVPTVDGTLVNDFGSGFESIAVSGEGAVQVVDLGSGSDQVTGASVDFALASDTASGVESVSVSVVFVVTDSGSGAEVVTVDAQSEFQVSDGGAGSESVGITATVLVADDGLGSEAVSNLTAALSALIDFAVGVESLSAAVQLALADLGAGADQNPVVLYLIEVLESAAGVDSVTPNSISIQVADSALVLDAMAAEALLETIMENAVASETVNRYDASAVIAKMRHRFSKRRMEIKLSL